MTTGPSSLTAALLAGDAAAARTLVLDALRGGTPPDAVAAGLVQPAMAEIGRLWEADAITFEREHLATAVCQSVMAELFAESDLAPPVPRQVVVACGPGNQHALGARLAADAFERHGWSVTFLGTDVSPDRLVEAVRQGKPDLIGLSVALPQHLPATRQVIERLRAELGPACPRVVVGGYAFEDAPESWRSVGADGYAPDAVAAGALARES